VPSVSRANLFADIPANLPAELMEALCHSECVRVERIVSRGHTSPAGFWYDQPQHEFVLLVSGGARLEFADGTPSPELVAGDWLVIPAHRKHRVAWTDPERETVWLAVHFDSQGARSRP
jgi:cupin 2 domain-containing protein